MAQGGFPLSLALSLRVEESPQLNTNTDSPLSLEGEG